MLWHFLWIPIQVWLFSFQFSELHVLFLVCFLTSSVLCFSSFSLLLPPFPFLLRVRGCLGFFWSVYGEWFKKRSAIVTVPYSSGRPLLIITSLKKKTTNFVYFGWSDVCSLQCCYINLTYVVGHRPTYFTLLRTWKKYRTGKEVYWAVPSADMQQKAG